MKNISYSPKITFAVIAYNQEEVVKNAIESAFEQTYEPLEIILSDDNSSDDTFEIMQQAADSYIGPHTVTVRKNILNVGLVEHIDKIMQIATGEFIVANAGDDISHPERTQKICDKWLEDKAAIKLVHSPVTLIDQKGKTIGEHTSPEEVILAPSTLMFGANTKFILGASMAWSRSLFDYFGPLGPNLSVEDRIIPFRAALLGRIEYIDEKLVKYRVGGASTKKTDIDLSLDYLHGLSHKLRKWHSESDLHILNNFSNVDYKDKAEIERACRKRYKLLSFSVGLEKAKQSDRFRKGPRALYLSLSERTTTPLKHWLMYSFEPIYLLYAKKKWSLTKKTEHRRTGLKKK